MTFSRKKLSVKWPFFEKKSKMSNEPLPKKRSVKWHFGLMTLYPTVFRSNHFLSKVNSVKQPFANFFPVKSCFGQMIFWSNGARPNGVRSTLMSFVRCKSWFLIFLKHKLMYVLHFSFFTNPNPPTWASSSALWKSCEIAFPCYFYRVSRRVPSNSKLQNNEDWLQITLHSSSNMISRPRRAGNKRNIFFQSFLFSTAGDVFAKPSHRFSSTHKKDGNRLKCCSRCITTTIYVDCIASGRPKHWWIGWPSHHFHPYTLRSSYLPVGIGKSVKRAINNDTISGWGCPTNARKKSEFFAWSTVCKFYDVLESKKMSENCWKAINCDGCKNRVIKTWFYSWDMAVIVLCERQFPSVRLFGISHPFYCVISVFVCECVCVWLPERNHKVYSHFCPP
jgi:hypothetical protein